MKQRLCPIENRTSEKIKIINIIGQFKIVFYTTIIKTNSNQFLIANQSKDMGGIYLYPQPSPMPIHYLLNSGSTLITNFRPSRILINDRCVQVCFITAGRLTESALR